MSVFDSIIASDKYKFYLDGEWRESTSGKGVSIKNPQTNKPAFTVQACTPAEVDAAYKGAAVAQQVWAKTPLWKRAELVKNAAAQLREHAEPIGKILTTEVAKQAKSATTEVIRSAELMEYCAEEAVRYLGQGT
jgi:glyceraldehyde-3-phosphate dehydrogenase (NADP+)